MSALQFRLLGRGLSLVTAVRVDHIVAWILFENSFGGCVTGLTSFFCVTESCLLVTVAGLLFIVGSFGREVGDCRLISVSYLPNVVVVCLVRLNRWDFLGLGRKTFLPGLLPLEPVRIIRVLVF